MFHTRKRTTQLLLYIVRGATPARSATRFAGEAQLCFPASKSGGKKRFALRIVRGLQRRRLGELARGYSNRGAARRPAELGAALGAAARAGLQHEGAASRTGFGGR